MLTVFTRTAQTVHLEVTALPNWRIAPMAVVSMAHGSLTVVWFLHFSSSTGTTVIFGLTIN